MTTQSTASVLDQRVRGAVRDLERVRVGPKAVGRQAARAGLRPLEDCRVGLVVNFVVIPALFIGYLMTVAASVPDEIKVGFCIAALCAGMPFAPLLARLARADVGISTTLVGGPDCRDHHRPPAGSAPRHRCGRRPAHDVVVGHRLAPTAVPAPATGSRVRLQGLVARPDTVTGAVGCPGGDPVPALQPQLHAGCLLERSSCRPGTPRSYVAAIAGPFIGLGCGYLLVSGLRVKDMRHQACDRGDDRGAQHRSDAADDDLSLWRRPADHGVDHDPQHDRHRDGSALRPDVEARCTTAGR